jgi:hypothetical protein
MDWLLVLLAAPPGGGLDPLRVQKGMFLLAMEGGLPPEQAYAFEPYAYGPMSRALYRDVRRLVDARLVCPHPVSGATWELFELSAAGAGAALSLRERALCERPASVASLDAIRRRISAMGFAELLDDVYERYPEYARNSVFRRPP